jgi:hypothetical protein
MITRNICYVLIIFSICACSQKKTLPIEGAWKLVQYQTINGDTVINEFPGKSVKDVIKIWSGNHFMGVGRTRIDTTVSDMYASGTYKLEGIMYEEYVNILMYKPWEGKTIKMTLELKNDTLIQTYPVDDKGKMDKEWAWIEKYVRIKNN